MNVLNDLIGLLEPYGIRPRFYYDRIHMYMDAATKKENINPILKGNDKLLFKQLKCYPHFDKKLELFQPSETQLSLLSEENVIKGDCAIQYVEFAFDFESKDYKQLTQLLAFFDKHLVYDQNPQMKNKSFYWACASNKDKKQLDDDSIGTRYYAARKEEKVLAVYIRKQSKLNNNACLHLEWRYRGIGGLKSHDIFTLKQLIEFDHFALWSNNLDLREPHLEKLGRSLSLKETNRRADNDRGNKKWSDILILQEYLNTSPHNHYVFEKISTLKKLKKLLSLYLNSHS